MLIRTELAELLNKYHATISIDPYGNYCAILIDNLAIVELRTTEQCISFLKNYTPNYAY